MSDADRIALDAWLRAHDADAFKGITSRYAGMVYGTCLRILRNQADAEDVTQECFAALAYARDASKVRSLGAWLHRVATNLALRRIRAETRRKQREERYAAEAAVATAPSLDDTLALVDEALAELPEQLRAPIVACYLENRSKGAIAEELGVSRQLVTHRVAKGLEQLRKTLRRKGVVITSAALGAMLAESATAEVPASVTAALGKMSLAGLGASVPPQTAAALAAIGRGGAGAGLLVAKYVAAMVALLTAALVACIATLNGPAPRVGLGEAAIETSGGINGAVDAVQAASIDPRPEADDVDVVMQAYRLRMAGRLEDAKAILLAAAKANPRDARAQFELARTAMHGLLPQDPVTDREAAQKASRASAKLAEQAIDRAIAADPENPRYHYWSGLVRMYGAMGNIHEVWRWAGVPRDMRQALKAYETALALDPDYHPARYEVRGLYDRLPRLLGGNPKKAEAHLKELDARHAVWAARARNASGVVSESGEKRSWTADERVEMWIEVVAAHPNDPDAHEGLAKAYLFRGRGKDNHPDYFTKAEEHILRTLDLDPARTSLLLTLGRDLYFAEEYEKAEQVVRQFLHTEPVAPLAANGMRVLAWTLEKRGKKDESATLLEQAAALHVIESFPEIPEQELFGPPE